MLLDSILLFRTTESMLRMKQRLQSLIPAPAAAAIDLDADPPVAHTATAPSASSTTPADAETEVMRNAAGEVLAWY